MFTLQVLMFNYSLQVSITIWLQPEGCSRLQPEATRMCERRQRRVNADLAWSCLLQRRIVTSVKVRWNLTWLVELRSHCKTSDMYQIWHHIRQWSGSDLKKITFVLFRLSKIIQSSLCVSHLTCFLGLTEACYHLCTITKHTLQTILQFNSSSGPRGDTPSIFFFSTFHFSIGWVEKNDSTFVTKSTTLLCCLWRSVQRLLL